MSPIMASIIILSGCIFWIRIILWIRKKRKTKKQRLEFNADYYFNRGVEDLGNVNITEAIENFSTAINMDPNFTEAYINRGNARFKWEGGTDECITDYTEVLRKKPDCVEAYVCRGNAYRDYRGNDTAKGKENAIKDYNEAIRLNPSCAEAYFGLGKIYHEENKSKAIENYNKAVRIKPNVGDLEGDAYYHRGLLYWEKGDVDQAIADYSEALKYDPRYAVVYKNRAEAYEKKGDAVRALADRQMHQKIAQEVLASFDRFREAQGD